MGASMNPRTSRDIRALKRSKIPRSPLLGLAGRLTNRDRSLCQDLFEHRVLTAHQIGDLYFPSGHTARRRLVELYRLAVLDRFRPPALGSAPNHYVLDELGARVVAAERGLEFNELRFRKEDVDQLPYRRELPHLVETNGFFTRIALACRQDPNYRLAEWWSERRCRSRWGNIVLADGFGILRGPQGECSFLLEFDRGTESPARLRLKLPPYERVALLHDRPHVILFCFPNAVREASVRRGLHPPGMALATASWDRFVEEPLGPVWLAIDEQRRRTLLDLCVAPSIEAARADLNEIGDFVYE
jgi:Replication-relaxation